MILKRQDERAIKAMCEVQILSFDDELKPHFCDILLNVNAYAKPSLYKNLVPATCELRCGFSYALIRGNFTKRRRKNALKFGIFSFVWVAQIAKISPPN